MKSNKILTDRQTDRQTVDDTVADSLLSRTAVEL